MTTGRYITAKRINVVQAIPYHLHMLIYAMMIIYHQYYSQCS